MHVSVDSLLLASMLAATSLAFWTFMRKPRIAPKSVRGAFAHLVASVALAQVALALIGSTIAIPAIGLAVVALGLVVAPMTYMLLSCMWFVDTALRSALSDTVR